MERYKKGEALQVNYLALKKTTGLTDVTMYVYNPSDTLVNTVVMTEVVAPSGMDALGLYRGSFTPALDGQYRVRIQSAVNGDDISKVFEIGNYKLDDLQGQLVTIDGNVDLIKIETDKIPAIKTETDKIPSIKTETDKIQTIDNNVDLVKTETDKIPAIKTETDKIAAIKTETDKIQTVDDNVDAIKTKTDNLPADTEAELAAIKAVVDDIDVNINPGGYIL
jgi:hypothetical protein